MQAATGIIKKAVKRSILLVAHGAGNDRAREGLRKFEELCKSRHPDCAIRWAYTSSTMRERLALQRQKSDSVRKALLRLKYENFCHVCVQPLQAICGHEYGLVCECVENVAIETGLSCQVGAPLLGSPADAERLAKALCMHLPPARQSQEAIIYMGHGAKHSAVSLYHDLAAELEKLDKNVFLGTMGGSRHIEDILPRVHSRVVWLLPLLSVIGAHALQDMAGEASQSWRSRIEISGHKCIPVLCGLTEYAHIAAIWLDNLDEAVRNSTLY